MSAPDGTRTRRVFAILVSLSVAGISVAATIPVTRRWIAAWVHELPGKDLFGHFVLMGLVAFACVLGFTDARPFGRRLGVLGVLGLVSLGVLADELI
ncbi:MAG: hypothetical protein AAF533_08455 [Acidobacteriota bacterium]